MCVLIFIYFYLHFFLMEYSDLSTTFFSASSSSLIREFFTKTHARHARELTTPMGPSVTQE